MPTLHRLHSQTEHKTTESQNKKIRGQAGHYSNCKQYNSNVSTFSTEQSLGPICVWATGPHTRQKHVTERL